MNIFRTITEAIENVNRLSLRIVKTEYSSAVLLYSVPSGATILYQAFADVHMNVNSSPTLLPSSNETVSLNDFTVSTVIFLRYI